MSSFLLDTHVLLWVQTDDAALGVSARRLILEAENSILISPISTLEIAQLIWKKRLSIMRSLSEWIAIALESLGATTIDISHQIAAGAYDIPGEIHGDPADRILISTARFLDCTLVTADQKILQSGIVKTHNANT